MFGITFTKAGKAKKEAKNLLSMSYKVYNYRRDVLSKSDEEKLKHLIECVETLIEEGKIGSKEYGKASIDLEAQMKKCGGKIYPVTFFSDNVDVIVVAAILAIGIRSFFLQPFQIPTNSMYPSFYGMVPEVYRVADDMPNVAEKVARFIFKGASNYSLKSEADGELYIEVNSLSDMNRNGLFANESRNVRRYFGIWPSIDKRYSFYVGDNRYEIDVPGDFSLDGVMQKAYPLGGEKKDLGDYLRSIIQSGKVVSKNGKYLLPLGNIKKGDYILNFDILAGDMLFVDRFTYNFRNPRVGEPFVFLTKYCDGLTAMNGGVPDDKYYIKRLVGQGGDNLKIKENTLYRNGEKATGSKAFDRNSRQEGLYCGYKPEGRFADGAEVILPPRTYYAMGDNSANSLDSRYWGEVPEKAVVGKALIIFYPFTSRWGSVD